MGKNIKSCVHCCNLKTVIITSKNQAQYPFSILNRINKLIKKKGQIRIYYCKVGIINKIYTTELIIKNLYRKNCPYYNIIPDMNDYMFYTWKQIIRKRGIYK